MNSTISSQSKSATDQKADNWFENLISSIRVDQLKYQTKTMHSEQYKMFSILIGNKPMEVLGEISSQMHLVGTSALLEKFLSELYQKQKHYPLEIAFDLSDQKLLVWAIIKEGDNKTERALYIAEAIVNAEFMKMNYSVSVTIVEDADNLPIPSQYRVLKGKKRG